LKPKRRPLTAPTEIVRVRPASRASASRVAASTGSRGSPSARGSTLVPPPGMQPSGGAPGPSPFSASLNPPSPENTKIASADSAASRASSVACPRRSVKNVATSAPRASARSTSAIRCSSTPVANGLTISAARRRPLT
jgi:hypothetical protein